MVSIGNKILAMCLTLTLIPLLILGFVNVNKTTDILEQKTQDTLFSAASMKEVSLEDYLDSSMALANSMARSPAVKAFASLIDDEGSEEYDSAYEKATEVIHSAQEGHWVIYHHMYIADTDGLVVLSPPHGDSTSSHINQDVSHSEFFESALEEPLVTDFFGFEESDHYHPILMYPIKSTGGKTEAVLVIEVEIGHVQKVLVDGFKLGETGRVFLSTLDGTPIVKLKAEELPALNTEGIKEAQKSGTVVGQFKNEHDVNIVGAYLKHEIYPWILVTEINADEAFSETQTIIWYYAIGIIMIATLLVVSILFISKQITGPIQRVVDSIKDIAEGEGDLTKRLKIESKDEVGDLAKWFNTLIEKIHNLIVQIKDSTDVTASSSQQLSASSEEIKASMEEIASTVGEIAKGAQTVSSSSETASVASKKTKDSALEGEKSAEVVTAKMAEIESSTKDGAEKIKALGNKSLEIGKIIETINGISEQTNLLALNAAIEAARAGDAGRGFAVVADEVRKLAEETGNATKQIRELIGGIQTDIQSSVETMDKNTVQVAEGGQAVQAALKSFEAIPGLVDNVNKSLDEMSAVAQENAAGSEQVAASVNQASEGMTQATKSAGDLNNAAATLKTLVSKFKVQNSIVSKDETKKELTSEEIEAYEKEAEKLLK